MKKVILLLLFASTSFALVAQYNTNVNDTLYYKKNNYSFYRTFTYVVVKEKYEGSNRFLVEKYQYDTIVNKPIKESKFTTLGLRQLRSDGLYIEYFKNGNKKLEGETSEGQRAPGSIWKYYYPNGQLKSEEKLFSDNSFKSSLRSLFKKIDYPYVVNFWDKNGEQLVENGSGTYRYENEEGLVEEGTLKDGLRIGIWKGIKNGELIFEEKYKKGKLVSGVSFDKRGEKYEYKQVNTPATYKTGGAGVVRQHIVSNFRENIINASGNLQVWFDVSKKGEISNIRFIRRLLPTYNKEVERIISEMEGWLPAKLRGQPVKSTYKLAINFK